jgi:hypothetical protein
MASIPLDQSHRNKISKFLDVEANLASHGIRLSDDLQKGLLSVAEYLLQASKILLEKIQKVYDQDEETFDYILEYESIDKVDNFKRTFEISDLKILAKYVPVQKGKDGFSSREPSDDVKLLIKWLEDNTVTSVWEKCRLYYQNYLNHLPGSLETIGTWRTIKDFTREILSKRNAAAKTFKIFQKQLLSSSLESIHDSICEKLDELARYTYILDKAPIPVPNSGASLPLGEYTFLILDVGDKESILQEIGQERDWTKSQVTKQRSYGFHHKVSYTSSC